MGRCDSRKIRYANPSDAQDHIEALRRIDHPSRAAHLVVYYCDVCLAYHVGHNYGRVQQRTARRGKNRRPKGM